MIRAIFLDVDGTLVSFRTHEVPASAREALLEAHRRGVRLFIATGRTVSNLAPVAGIPYDGVVSLNGARCVDRDGRVVSVHPIPQADFDRVAELAAELDFPIVLELDEGLFVDRVTPEVEGLARMVALPVPAVTDIRRRFAESDCCQLCLFFDEQTERRVIAEVPTLVAARWHPTFADVNVRDVDKATGMAEFAAHYGFAPEETMAFGDGGNDVPMLRAAGIGVAMGGSCAAALAAADYVTSEVEQDGIRRALEHFGVIGDTKKD